MARRLFFIRCITLITICIFCTTIIVHLHNTLINLEKDNWQHICDVVKYSGTTYFYLKDTACSQIKSQSNSGDTFYASDDRKEVSLESSYYIQVAGFGKKENADACVRRLLRRGVACKVNSYPYLTPKLKRKRLWHQVITESMSMSETKLIINMLKKEDGITGCIVCQSA